MLRMNSSKVACKSRNIVADELTDGESIKDERCQGSVTMSELAEKEVSVCS